MRRLPVIAMFAVDLVIGLWLVLSTADAAGPGCAVTYTVQRGDTLREIALQAGTTALRLARINQIKNPDLIRVGQVLCLPRFALAPHPSFDLVAEYTLNPRDNTFIKGTDWALGPSGMAGKRERYPLLERQATRRYTDTLQLQRASAGAGPLFWLVPREKIPPDYILVVIGNPAPLLALRVGNAPTLDELFPANAGECPPSRPVDRLMVAGQSTQIRLRGELVNIDGSFIAAPISAINYFKTAQDAGGCSKGISFALHSTDNPDVEGYRLRAVLTNRIAGPPPPAVGTY